MKVSKGSIAIAKHDRKRHLMERILSLRIGIYMMRFSRMELWLDDILLSALGKPRNHPDVRDLMKEPISKRLNKTKKLLIGGCDRAAHADVKAWHQEMTDIITTRNSICHGFWGTSGLGGDISLLQMPTRKPRMQIADTVGFLAAKSMITSGIDAIDDMMFKMAINARFFSGGERVFSRTARPK
nr:hypothetical protein [uncultured Rhodopila sp.]